MKKSKSIYGFKQTYRDNAPRAKFFGYESAIMNRGKLENFLNDEVFEFFANVQM